MTFHVSRTNTSHPPSHPPPVILSCFVALACQCLVAGFNVEPCSVRPLAENSVSKTSHLNELEVTPENITYTLLSESPSLLQTQPFSTCVAQWFRSLPATLCLELCVRRTAGWQSSTFLLISLELIIKPDALPTTTHSRVSLCRENHNTVSQGCFLNTSNWKF